MLPASAKDRHINNSRLSLRERTLFRGAKDDNPTAINVPARVVFQLTGMSRVIMMKLSNVVSKIRQRGLGNCLRYLVLQTNDRWQEWRLGIRTSEMIHWRELGLGEASESYEAIDYGTFARVLRRIKIRPDDVFLDYGCGMGRVVVLAARKRFRRVMGVELSSRLCSIAEKNLQIAQRGFRCGSAHIIHMDAGAFVVPGDVSIVFLFSPFFGEVMRKVTARIRESLAADPRDITIIHVIPDNVASAFHECNWLSKTAEFRVGVWNQLTCFMFQNVNRGSIQPPHAH